MELKYLDRKDFNYDTTKVAEEKSAPKSDIVVRLLSYCGILSRTTVIDMEIRLQDYEYSEVYTGGYSVCGHDVCDVYTVHHTTIL